MSIITIILLLIVLSQFYWAWALRGLLKKKLQAARARRIAGAAALAAYLFMIAYNIGVFRSGRTPVRLTIAQALFAAPFLWWMASSLFGFIVVIFVWLVKGIGMGAVWVARKAASPRAKDRVAEPARRHFLETTAAAITAAPFVAGAYGLLYGRLNLETPRQPIRLAKLPRAFHGFRIAQLSDIHIGPFMTEEEIRKYVAIANSLKPHLIVLTGDFVTFDGRTQYSVVSALSGLRAPFGVFGCLGNHDAWSHVQDSITALFRETNTRILRTERAPIVRGADAINLMGVDFQSEHRFGPTPGVRHLLEGVDQLMQPDQVNLLLSHNPNTFDRAAEMGIDLSVAGHTHGGQAALEFISPELAPSRLITPYVAGLFEKPGGQLYVNRGIGTIGVPIRLGAPPEITLYELVRE